MGKNWDSAKHWNTGEGKHGTFKGTGYTGKKRPAFYQNSNEDKMVFYNWCFDRAEKLFFIMKPGGYVAIFGHPKTNHRMKCAFEDAGFKVVEEIDWVYLTGMPKNQDIGKLFDKVAGAEREIVGVDNTKLRPNRKSENEGGERVLAGGFQSDNGDTITAPTSDLAKRYDGWKTAGLKPAHEPITIFQKPLEGTYTQNIEKYGCGGMNIDACRVPINPDVDDPRLGGKGDWSTKKAAENIYEGGYAGDRVSSSELGRFPANIILDEGAAKLFDEQTGVDRGAKAPVKSGKDGTSNGIYGDYNNKGDDGKTFRGDTGGGSRMFTVIKYCTKVSQSERKLPDGERNPHVTLKPVELIKWLIKLLTPQDGLTIDITAGSCTHGVACEQLNKNDNYNLRWVDIELMNTEDEPYCNVGKMRVESA